ncbi:MAG: hypothetical protein E6Q95_02430 [Chitinophagaceae bacterium]|nr:MAG: hypothetical protein E6Q95_02430 [Chitinophagaceae bacterium]
MKYLQTLLCTLFIAVFFIACKSKEEANQAQNYYNQIDTLQNQLKNQLVLTNNALEGDIQYAAADSIKNKMLASIDEFKNKLNRLEFLANDESLKESFNNLLNNYHKTFTEAYPKIFEIRFDSTKQTEENVIVLSEIIRTIDAGEAEFGNKFVQAQKSFKSTYKLP